MSAHSNNKKASLDTVVLFWEGFNLNMHIYMYVIFMPREARALRRHSREALSRVRGFLIVCVFIYMFIYIYVYIFMCVYIFVPREAHALLRHSGGALSSARCVWVCVCVCVGVCVSASKGGSCHTYSE